MALTPETWHTDDFLVGIYRNSIINGFSLVITAVVQTMQKKLDLYHAMFVMQIIFSLNFIYGYGMLCVPSSFTIFETLTRRGVGQKRFIRTRRNDLRLKIFIGVQTFTTAVFTIWLLYVWIKGSNFGSQPSCNHLVRYVVFFADVRATAIWLRVLFIINLVISSCALLFRFGVISSKHMEKLRNRIQAAVWRDIFRIELQESYEPQESQQPQEEEVFRFVTLSLVYVHQIMFLW
jgi:hypothetical protein